MKKVKQVIMLRSLESLFVFETGSWWYTILMGGIVVTDKIC